MVDTHLMMNTKFEKYKNCKNYITLLATQYLLFILIAFYGPCFFPDYRAYMIEMNYDMHLILFGMVFEIVSLNLIYSNKGSTYNDTRVNMNIIVFFHALVMMGFGLTLSVETINSSIVYTSGLLGTFFSLII